VRLPADIRAALVDAGSRSGGDVDLAETALVLASITRPGVPIDPYRRHLDSVVEEVRHYAGGGDGGDLELRIEALAQVIIKRYGYGAGDDVFDDLDAANLMRVIDSRSGLPVALGIIFIHAAQSLGWAAGGIDFPGHFLVRLDHLGERAVIDPFDGGRALHAQDLRAILKAMTGNHAELTPDTYQGMTARDVLLRLQDNIKWRRLREDHVDEALEVIETMLLFAPGAAYLWRECGVLQSRLDRIPDAVASLEEYIRLSGADEARYNATILLQELRGRLN
jgi:regulator of sirC expression with transglutaminase-like and TPR domain